MLVDILIGLSGLIGIGLLAVPAIHADRHALKISKLVQMASPINSPLADDIKEEAVKSLVRAQFKWNWKYSTCLRAGTILTALSQVIVIFKAFLGPAAT